MIQELKVNFDEANGSIMPVPDYQLPTSNVGDEVLLFDDDIECDGRIVGKVRKASGSTFLVLIPSELARDGA